MKIGQEGNIDKKVVSLHRDRNKRRKFHKDDIWCHWGESWEQTIRKIQVCSVSAEGRFKNALIRSGWILLIKYWWLNTIGIKLLLMTQSNADQQRDSVWHGYSDSYHFFLWHHPPLHHQRSLHVTFDEEESKNCIWEVFIDEV